MSDFLDKLKESVDKGEFNSDVANKINEINEKTDKFLKEKSIDELKEAVNTRIDGVINDSETKEISDDVVEEINFKHYDRIKNMMEIDKNNKLITDMLNLSIDLDKGIETLKKINDEINTERIPVEWKESIEEIRNKYIV